MISTMKTLKHWKKRLEGRKTYHAHEVEESIPRNWLSYQKHLSTHSSQFQWMSQWHSLDKHKKELKISTEAQIPSRSPKQPSAQRMNASYKLHYRVIVIKTNTRHIAIFKDWTFDLFFLTFQWFLLSLDSVTELGIFGRVILPCFFIFLVFLSCNLCIS